MKETVKAKMVCFRNCFLEGSWWLFERQDDWSSCAYFYLDRPVNNLPTIAPVADRIAGLAEEPR